MFHKKDFKHAFILFVIIFSSCGRRVPCIEPHPILNFVSFSDAETDSLILRRYVRNSNVDSLVDSTIISRNNSMYEKSNDTLHILTAVGGDYPLDIQFDYEVYMPLANKLFQINNIVQQQTEMNIGISLDKNVCINPIKSYVLNGQIISGAYDYHFIYLKK